MEISTPRQLLRSLGPLPETSLRPPPPELPRSPSMSFSNRQAGWRTVLVSQRYLEDRTLLR